MNESLLAPHRIAAAISHRMFPILILLLLLPLVAGAQPSTVPGEILVRLKFAPERSHLDGALRTGLASVDDLAAAGRITVDAPLAALAPQFPEVEPVILLRVSESVNADSLLRALADDPQVDWASPNHRFRPNSLDEGYQPSDSLFGEQWWLERISAPLAWELTRGDRSVIIGIIDTGVDYLHPDLQPNVFINEADADSDGVDDDNNGFIDDVVGWDFVDAPTLPSAGDHRVRDNDPMDELGHGTYVAGVAAAATDNASCYASVAFNCRILCLRAGNSEGFLEEDDISAALLYGAQMGARVINMSFGDVVASPLLRETVRIASQAGVILVGSAGNGFSEAIHYPSGYPEVIAVGATDELDRRAQFSNYGPMVELMAPGYGIRSSIVGGTCGEWAYPHGTSYAAPMVAGTAALMLTVNPALTPEDVQQILRSTTDDTRPAGWDPETANGRLNVRRAVEQAAFGSDVIARIHTPRTDDGLTGAFDVVGDAWGAAFDHYVLYYGVGENPDVWIPVASGTERVHASLLGRVENLPPQDTVLIVRLETHGAQGAVSVDHAHVFLQRTPPVIDSIIVRRMLDYDTYGDLVQVWANQITSASLLLTNTAGDSLREDFGYVDDEHAGFLSQRVHPGIWQVRVRLENAAGVDVVSAPFTFAVSEPPFTSNLWERTETSLSHGYLGSFSTDYNCNGRREVWRLPIDADGILSDLEVHEWNGTDFESLPVTYGVHLPQAAADADGDGLLEMMGRRALLTRIWEQTEPCGPLNSVVFEDTANFLGAGYVDLDSTDGQLELLARLYTGGQGFERPRYLLFDVGENYSLTPLDTLPNDTDGPDDLGPPRVLIGDLDRDGRLDFLYGDYDGDLVFCERAGGDIVQQWSYRLPLNDATNWLAAGDLDGDGESEIVAGCRSNRAGASESQRRSQHWEYFIFDRSGDNQFAVVDSILILGAEDVGSYPASVTVADVDGDLRAEILLSTYPDFYVIRRDQATGRYTPRWYHTPSVSNTSLVADWNGNGVQEFYFSTGDRFARAEAAAASGQRPAPPLNLTGEPLGPHVVQLSWNVVAGADSYRVFRAEAVPAFVLVAATVDTFMALAGVPQDVPYTYAVATFDAAFPEPQSVYSNYVPLTANLAPTAADTARFVPPNFVEIRFSEAMGPSALYQWNYRLEDGRMPAVVSAGEGGRLIYLAFDGELAVSWHTITLRDLRDAQGSRLPDMEAQVVFEVAPGPAETPYVISHRIVGGPASSTVEIVFSEPMDESVLLAANYVMDAPRSVQSVRALESDLSRIELSLDPRYPVGALGLPARLQLRNLASAEGALMDTTGGRADLILGGAAATVSDAYVFPNPYKGVGPAGEPGVMFAGLPEQATIRVFTLQGLPVRKLEHNNASGAARWDLTNEDGDAVAGGVYLFTIESGGKTVRGKLAVLR